MQLVAIPRNLRLFDVTGSLFLSGKASTLSAQLAAIAVRGAIPAFRRIERPDTRSTAKIIPFKRRRG